MKEILEVRERRQPGALLITNDVELLALQKNTSPRGSKPLKACIMQASVISFQTYASRSLQWLHDVIGKSDALRRLFCDTVLTLRPGEEQSLAERLLLSDTKFWKCLSLEIKLLTTSRCVC